MATSLGYKINKQPIAQSFFVDEIAGIYCTKVDLFFAAKDNNFPVTLHFRPMVNGYPSSDEIIPGTQVVVPGSSVNTSTDATTATTFTFDEPVFLKGLTDFALVLTADSIDYQVYIAETNEFQVGSTERRVNKQPVLGSLFYSQNSATFTAAQNQDLTFKIHQAKFTKNTGTVVLKNAALPKRLLVANPLTVTSGSAVVTVKHEGHGLQIGDQISLTGVDSAGVGGITRASLIGTRSVTAIDASGFRYSADSSADSDAVGGGLAVQSTKNILYSIAYPHLQTLQPINTVINSGIKATTSKSYAGGETAYQKETEFSNLTLNKNNEANELYAIVNNTTEASELGSGVKSLEVAVNVKSIDSNVSPMIDLQRASMTGIAYNVDRQSNSATTGFNVPFNFVNETSATGGSSASKHITRQITLAQDAVGAKVIFSANRPAASDFQLFFRTATGDEVLIDQPFVLQPEETNNPSDENRTVFREYQYLIGGQGGDLPAFTQMQFKIVFRSTNMARIPVIKDLRVIALSA